MIKYILLLFFFLSKLISIGQSSDSTLFRITNKLDSIPNGVAISIAIINDDSIRFIGLEKSNGKLNQTNLKDSLFEIGSLTKVFTSTLLANEVINNNLNITKSINKYFPYKFNNKIKVSFQSLSNHTSGLYRLPSNILALFGKTPDNPYKNYTYKLLDEFLKNEMSLNTPNTYSYSNLGAGILAYALSQKTDASFEHLLCEVIFQKYNMNHTSFTEKTSYKGIGANNQITENWEFNALKGAGGLISSTSDLSNFVIAQFDQTNLTLNLTRKETYRISDNMAIGLGWHILSPKKTEEKYWHNGGTGGYTSSIAFRTSNKTGVIVLSNLSPMHKQSTVIDELSFELLDSFLE